MLQDRVEASPEQLAAAMATAERLSEEGGGPKVRVIGWCAHPGPAVAQGAVTRTGSAGRPSPAHVRAAGQRTRALGHKALPDDGA